MTQPSTSCLDIRKRDVDHRVEPSVRWGVSVRENFPERSRDMPAHALKPATELVKKSQSRYPNESDAYRRARNELLAEEIELRRHIERVAEQSRKLPPGGEVTRAYAFEGEQGPVTFVDLFGKKDTLVIFSYMFGSQRETPCPMCTSLMGSWDHKVPDIEQRVAFACVARAP